jgi:hypothetical protein
MEKMAYLLSIFVLLALLVFTLLFKDLVVFTASLTVISAIVFFVCKPIKLNEKNDSKNNKKS